MQVREVLSVSDYKSKHFVGACGNYSNVGTERQFRVEQYPKILDYKAFCKDSITQGVVIIDGLFFFFFFEKLID